VKPVCTSRLWLWLFVACFPAGAFSPHAVAADDGIEDGDEVRKWQEAAVEFPAFPRQEDLLTFYVSAATDNRFFVDGSTLSVGGDGVVRYVLVVEAAGGARNVTFEGLRCQTKERRLYASGRVDGTWSRSRNDEWKRLQSLAANRHHAALYFDYFCPEGNIVGSVDEARDALRRGGKADRIMNIR
jgi:CNP1-like family